jgi:hypothetical protein
MKLTSEVAAKARKIRLVLMDVDGVMTDGSILFTGDGNEVKVFHAQDGVGIKMAQRVGLEVGVITGRQSTAVESRCAELGIGITLQPAFLISPLEPISYLEQILGPRAAVGSPLRSIVDRGVHLSGGSDGPVTHPDPIEGIYGACNHPYDPAQSLTIPEALKMYTREVAWGTFDEKERGTLERGKIADMVILNQNPLALEPADLRQLEPEQLLLGGLPYTPGKGVWSALTGGLLGRGEAI